MNDSYEEIKEAITKEITAAQLSGSKYKFKCSICGSQHSADSKVWQKCLSKFFWYQNPYLNQFLYDTYAYNKLTVIFSQFKISIKLPGFSICSLQNKPDKIVEFFKDYYRIVQADKDENISIYNNAIVYNFTDELSKKFPFLFLVKNYNEYIAFKYEKTLYEKLPMIKNKLLDLTQVIKKHARLFIDQDESKSAQTSFSSENNENNSYSLHVSNIAQKVCASLGTESYYIALDTVADFVKHFLKWYYNNDAIDLHILNTIDSLRDDRDCVSFSCMGNTYAYASTNYHKIDDNAVKIIVSTNNNRYDKKLQQFLIDIARQLLPIRNLMQYIFLSAIKERKYKTNHNKQNGQQIGLDMLTSL